VLLDPVTRRLAEQLAVKQRGPETDGGTDGGKAASAKQSRRSSSRASELGSKAAAIPIGTVLGYLSGKVLGQYDPFAPDAEQSGHGRLLLVAPNIVNVERQLNVNPGDFRLWVCLHESTHRLQFAAVPWLRNHFRSLVDDFADATDLDPGQLAERLWGALRNRRSSKVSWIEATQNEAQRAAFDQLLALMTLLEGHADHVMDAAGPDVVPSVAAIRVAFNERRRRGNSLLDRVIRALLGMDMKLQQYVKGNAFVTDVVSRVGMTRFNTVWASPETLPTRSEISDPASWVARVEP
jgi:coenzyme F420 biosynthesis associated uncharacterized protein